MKNKNFRLSAFAREFDLPEDIGPDGYHIEICGGTLVLDGCRSIAEYGENVIRLNTGGKIISILGTSLVIRDFACCQVTVSGMIASVEIGG